MHPLSALAAGLLIGTVIQNIVHRKLRAEVDLLLETVAVSTYVDGRIRDAVGGLVTVTVDPEFEYPTVGARCRLLEFETAG